MHASAKLMRYTNQNRAGTTVTSSNNNMRAALERSAIIMVRLRSQRSTNTPATDDRIIQGSTLAANVRPVARGEPYAHRHRKATPPLIPNHQDWRSGRQSRGGNSCDSAEQYTMLYSFSN